MSEGNASSSNIEKILERVASQAVPVRGAGVASDKETEMRIRAEWENRWELDRERKRKDCRNKTSAASEEKMVTGE